MAVIWTATRDLQVGAAGTPLSTYHKTAHDNIELEIASISTALNAPLPYAKMSLTDSIVNADINSAAAIASTKLAGAKATRRISLPTPAFYVFQNATATISNDLFLYTMNDTVESYVGSSFIIPKDWVSGTDMTIRIRILESTVTGNAYMSASASRWKAGMASASILNTAVAIACSNTNNTQREGTITLPGSTIDAEDVVNLKVGRVATNVLDTVNGANIYLVAVCLDYTSSI